MLYDYDYVNECYVNAMKSIYAKFHLDFYSILLSRLCSSSCSFNTRELGEGSINLNTTVGDEEDEVEELCRSCPIGRDQAKRKAKAGSVAGSENALDVESLAKMIDNEYVMANDPYNVQKSQDMSKLLRIKNKELELKVAELEIRRLENRQRDEALYETTTDEDLKAILRKRLFG
ncbi:hypothetical protein Tco_0662141 [Tanacetum coccineum]